MINFLKNKLNCIINKKTRSQEIESRVDKLFNLLVTDIEFHLNDLETVQACNLLKIKLKDHLVHKKAKEIELSSLHHQNAEQITLASTFLE